MLTIFPTHGSRATRYYFKVAQNITGGRGITDGINLTNGYHPLKIACIIFALARFDLILPLRVMLMVMALLNAATAVLIYRLVKNNLSHAVALLAAPFWAFNFYIHNNVYEFGLETPLAAFAIVLFIYKLSQFERDWPPKRAKPVTARQLATLAVSAVIVMFSRLDLVFLAVIGGIWIIFRGKPIRFLLPLDMVIIFISMTASVALRTYIIRYNLYLRLRLCKLYSRSLSRSSLTCLAYQHPNQFGNDPSNHIGFTTSAVLITGLYLLIQLGIGRISHAAPLLDLALAHSSFSRLANSLLVWQ